MHFNDLWQFLGSSQLAELTSLSSLAIAAILKKSYFNARALDNSKESTAISRGLPLLFVSQQNS